MGEAKRTNEALVAQVRDLAILSIREGDILVVFMPPDWPPEAVPSAHAFFKRTLAEVGKETTPVAFLPAGADIEILRHVAKPKIIT